MTGANPITDPLEHLQTPSPFPSCTNNSNINVHGGDTVTLVPCVYTGKLTIHGTVNFDPGLYVFDDAGITINSSATVTGTGVHFYLTENNGNNDSFDISAGANVTLTAGITNDWGMAGVLIYHDRNAPSNVTHNLTGSGTMDLEGILYFPTTDVKYAGGSAFDTNASMIIADEVQITGNTNLGDFDGSATQANTLLIIARLAE